MEIFSGKLFIDLATQVETEEESVMKQKAHEKLTSDLFEEISLIVGAAGFLVGSIGATLEKVEDVRASDFSLLKSQVEKSRKEVQHRVYNKANIHTYKIQ